MNEDLQNLLNYAYFFLKFRPRTKKEIKNYLLKKIKTRHWSTDHVEEVIKDLEEQDLINDKNFVAWFIEQRNSAKPKSEFVLRHELLRHGINKELIEEYFNKNPQDEDALAEAALKPKWHRFKNLPKEKSFQKAVGFLARRGFSYGIAKSTIQKLREEK